MKPILKQVLKIIALTVLLWVIFFITEQLVATAHLVHEWYTEIILFSALIALFVAVVNQYNFNKNSSNAMAIFLLATFIRVIFSFILIGWLLLRNPADKLILVLNFFIIYLCYLSFEIYAIIVILRPISNKPLQ